MQGIGPEGEKQIEELVVQLGEDWLKIQAKEAEVNEKIVDLNDAIQAYNNTLKNVKDFRDGVVKKMNEHAENQPEDWEETEEGDKFESWMNEWQAVDTHPMDLIDELNISEPEHAAELSELYAAPE